MCTIADAKVPLGSAAWLVQELNHNCYNVYFYECLPKKSTFSLIFVIAKRLLPSGRKNASTYAGISSYFLARRL